ncbi:hypothetical protein PTKIN_Ptkin03bG0017300 [Pterospermum kingtungense]
MRGSLTNLNSRGTESLRVAAKGDVLERKTHWVEAVKSWASIELVKPPVNEADISEGRSSARVIQFAPGNGHIYGESKLSMSNGDPEAVSLADAPQNLVAPSCKEIPTRATLNKPNREVLLKEGQENLASAEGASCNKILDGAALGKAVGYICLPATKTVNFNGVENPCLVGSTFIWRNT